MVKNPEASYLCCVLNESTEDHLAFLLSEDSTVQHLYDQVARRWDRDQYSFKLRINIVGDGPIFDSVNLHNRKTKNLKDVGFQIGSDVKNQITLTMKDVKEVKDAEREDFGGFGDSVLSPPPDPPPPPPTTTPTSNTWPSVAYDDHPSGSMPIPFVGLVNQAMTCYLNSLLQALFMTPEFRNAMYRWKYDNSPGSELPLELQKLFLKLQTSKRASVETTALTKSFGWNSSDAWQQHDIQELCRLLFDALERQFKGTDQADLINCLYEGTMLDYVKCLDCSTERHREDKFLDIPLPVRPFGSTAAYNSVEEALRAFVQPELLDGSNQYHCETCNKKCDAHKGLKFTKFPYLLTLHLKRFAFDYNTLNRIKLNDKVTFPYKLNLNGFLKKSNGDGVAELVAEEVVKCDECSTADSGSAFDEENVESPTPAAAIHIDPQDEDEGIDVSNTTESEKNRANASEPGPYLYDLFSIMIHSGSASGGHYYAYIKDYTSGGWFCFNDQSVQRINEEDIERTYGGGNRFSASCYSSTNAYMLMYRQIDPARNLTAMAESEFPSHLHEQLKSIEEEKELQHRIQQGEKELLRIKCYYKDSNDEKPRMFRLCVNKNDTLRSVLEDTMERFYLTADSVPIERCRLVIYDSSKQVVECSFEGRDNEKIGELVLDGYMDRDLLLQVRGPNDVFPVHRIGDITTKVMVIDPVTGDLEGPIVVPSNENDMTEKYRLDVANATRSDPAATQLFVATYVYVQPVSDYSKTVRDSRIRNKERVYVYKSAVVDDLNRACQAVLRANNIVNLHINLPLVTDEILQEYNIPTTCEEIGDARMPSPVDCPYISGATEDLLTGAYSDQSASEDSSLTDSERTIVGDAPSSPDNMSPRVSPVSERRTTSPNLLFLDRSFGDVNEKLDNDCSYFKIKSNSSPNSQRLEVLVSKNMRSNELKNLLESRVGVAKEYFKMFLQMHGLETELHPEKTLEKAHDDSVITIKLGRAPRQGETCGKVYLLDLSQDEPEKYLFDWLIAEGAPVNEVKRELLNEAHRRCGMNLTFERCRLRQKKYKIPEQPFMDNANISDIPSNWEIYIQEVNENDPTRTSEKQKLVFARQWFPSSRTLSPYTEYILDGDTVAEFARKVSEKCAIPLEDVEYACGETAFPCRITNDRDVHSDLDWKQACLSQDNDTLPVYPIRRNDKSGVLFFRNSKEILQQRKIETSNCTNPRTNDSKSRIYQKKEQALRICADLSDRDSSML